MAKKIPVKIHLKCPPDTNPSAGGAELWFLGSHQGPCQTYMKSSCYLNLGLFLIKFNTCEQDLPGKQFFCILSVFQEFGNFVQ